MMRSKMRSTMKTALLRPVSEIRMNPSSTKFRSPGVKNKFSTAVNTTMNTTGFKPLTIVLKGTLETFTQPKRVRPMRP